MKFLLSVTVVLLATVAATDGCRFPPQLWCSSEAVARECKVLDQCLHTVWTERASAPLVSLELYYESLCPDCRQFISQQLYPTWTNLKDIMDVTLVSYGNAIERKSGGQWEFTCQHGPKECMGNLLETCSIHQLQDMNKVMPFIHCMELSDNPTVQLKKCANQLQVDSAPILACANGSLGNHLEHEMAVKTDALIPSHTYVPWIVLNGVHTEQMNDEAMKDLSKLICDTYKGPKPPTCHQAEIKLKGCLKPN